MANMQTGERGVNDFIFNNLLASAYSLQQRQDRLKSRVPASKSSELLSAVVDTQRLVWRHAIHPDTALQLIASRSQKLSGAAGTAVALLNGESLEYRVAIGIATALAGSKILADASFSFQQLRSEPVVESSTWRDKALATRLMANSVLSVPLHRNGTLAGCLQLFSRVGQFSEEAVYACELMSTVLNQLLEESDPEVSDEQPRAAHNVGEPSELEDRKPVCTHSSPAVIVEKDEPPLSPGALAFEQQGLSQNPADHRAVSGPDRMRSGNLQPQAPKAHAPPSARTIMYPMLVILFAAIANIFSRVRDWHLELATALILVFTLIELTKIWRRREQP